MGFLKSLHDSIVALTNIEHRFDPFYRPLLDAILREPLARLAQVLIRLRYGDEGSELAREIPLPNEDEFVEAIIENMGAYMRSIYAPGQFERGGNTKTHAVVRGEFIVKPDLPDDWRQGVFREPRPFPA